MTLNNRIYKFMDYSYNKTLCGNENEKILIYKKTLILLTKIMLQKWICWCYMIM